MSIFILLILSVLLLTTSSVGKEMQSSSQHIITSDNSAFITWNHYDIVIFSLSERNIIDAYFIAKKSQRRIKAKFLFL